MNKRILSLLLVFCFCFIFLASLSGCGSSDPEFRTYHKVYKGADGYYHGRDVTYDSNVEFSGGEIIVLIVVAVIIGISVMNKKK